jgi:choline dehydrogenase-like flavoprotein
MPQQSESVRFVIIGSGPAAMAAASALVSAGHRITIVDVGYELDSDRKQVLSELASKEKSEWSNAALRAISSPDDAQSGHKDLGHAKRSYGSSYSFAGANSPLNIIWKKGKSFNHSLAKGGLSNVWGSSILPMRAMDMQGWPFPLAELEPHYKAVAELIPITRSGTGIDAILPTYSSQSHSIPLSTQARALLDDLAVHRQTLGKRGIHFGESRLAILAEGDPYHKACNLCGRCLTGCPYRLIYSSAHTLDKLLLSPLVTYLPGRLVERIESSSDSITIHGTNKRDSTPFSITATRAFLGAGVLPTAKIILSSLSAEKSRVTLQDSQYFIYPLLRFSAVPSAEIEEKHTSAQIFLEIDDPAISSHLVHIQLYGHSDFLVKELEATFLRIPLRWKWFRNNFIGRLMIAQGFLHSSHSGSIDLELTTTPSGASALSASCIPSFRAFKKVLQVGWKLLSHAFQLRAAPLFPGLKFPDPGASYHSGGSFPMSDSPVGMQTDTLGRLREHPRLHIVDASVMPSIPATTITFTVMANSHRIASAAASLDPL